MFWRMRDRMRRERRWQRRLRGLCGCGGELSETGYCQKFVKSKFFEDLVAGEAYYRSIGWGHKTNVFTHCGDAVMSDHRQIFGAFPEDFESVLFGRS